VARRTHIVIRIYEHGYKNLAILFNELERRTLIRAIGFSAHPFPHLHVYALVTDESLYERLRKLNGLFFRFIPVRSRSHERNLVRYIENHEEVFDLTKQKISDILKAILAKLENLDKRISEIEQRLNATAEKGVKADVIEVNLSRMNVRFSPAQKGIGMRIRFAKFIKPNQRGEYYVVLTPNDVNELRNALTSLKIGNDEQKKGVSTESVDEALE